MLNGFKLVLARGLVPACVSLFLSSSALAADAPAVLVRLGDIEVTTLDLEADLQRLNPAQREQALAQPDAVKRMAGTILYWRKIAREAEAASVADDPLVAAQLRISNERLLGELYLLKADLESVPTAQIEGLARAEYNAHPERFAAQEQVRASHILVSVNNRKPEDVQARLAEVKAELDAGKPFAEVAARLSDDPVSAQRGGDLGSFGRGRMVAPFEEAAFRLSSPGDISPPVRTQFGWHIIRLEERSSGGVRSFEEIRPQLLAEIRAKLIADKRQERAMAMQNDASLQFDEAAISAFSAGKP